MEILVDTRDISAVSCELLGLWCFSDERPLKGLTGLLDWRLDTAVSRLIMAGTVSGFWGEKVLMCGFDACPSQGFLLMGLGSMAEFDEERMREAGRLMASSLVKLRRKTVCMSLPGNGIPRIDVSAVAEHFLYGMIREAKGSDLSPTFLCGLSDVDETLLGFQKTKVSLKSHIPADIVQVKS
jgi:hypothetical protein